MIEKLKNIPIFNENIIRNICNSNQDSNIYNIQLDSLQTVDNPIHIHQFTVLDEISLFPVIYASDFYNLFDLYILQ